MVLVLELDGLYLTVPAFNVGPVGEVIVSQIVSRYEASRY